MTDHDIYSQRAELQDRINLLARERGWLIWVTPARTVMEEPDYHVHFNHQSYWTTVGLRSRSPERGGNLAWAFERAREGMADFRRPRLVLR